MTDDRETLIKMLDKWVEDADGHNPPDECVCSNDALCLHHLDRIRLYCKSITPKLVRRIVTQLKHFSESVDDLHGEANAEDRET